MKVGDIIKCRDEDDIADTMIELAKLGIETDFVFERNGQPGYWLEVTETPPPDPQKGAAQSGGEYADAPTLAPAT